MGSDERKPTLWMKGVATYRGAAESGVGVEGARPEASVNLEARSTPAEGKGSTGEGGGGSTKGGEDVDEEAAESMTVNLEGCGRATAGCADEPSRSSVMRALREGGRDARLDVWRERDGDGVREPRRGALRRCGVWPGSRLRS